MIVTKFIQPKSVTGTKHFYYLKNMDVKKNKTFYVNVYKQLIEV